jgi:hypothetical protein
VAEARDPVRRAALPGIVLGGLALGLALLPWHRMRSGGVHSGYGHLDVFFYLLPAAVAAELLLLVLPRWRRLRAALALVVGGGGLILTVAAPIAALIPHRWANFHLLLAPRALFAVVFALALVGGYQAASALVPEKT